MRSFQVRLLLLLVIFIILPYFLSVFIIYGNTKSSIENKELEKSREELREAGNDLEQHFEKMITLPYSVYNMPDILQVFDEGLPKENSSNFLSFEKSIETFSATRPELVQLRFYFHKEKESLIVYKSNLSAPKTQSNYVKHPPFKQLYQSEQDYVIEEPHKAKNYDNVPIIPKTEDSMVVTMHHKIKNILSEEFLGFLTMDIDITSYSPLVKQLEGDDGTSVFLLNEDYKVMYSSDSKQMGQTISKKELTALSESTELVLTESLQAPLNNWRVVKIISKDALFQDAKKAAYTNVVLGLGVVVLGVIMVFLISRIVTKPIRVLSDKVRSIEGGNMDVMLTTSRKDEIGHLENHMQEMLHRINNHIDREYKLEIEVKKSQLRALKSQVNPHFLFNALQSIGAVALDSGAKGVYGLIISLSKMMRYSLQADQLVTVDKELDYIHSYLVLQKERFGEEVDVQFSVDKEVENELIPSMLLQPLVENYFKHSYEKYSDESRLEIIGEKERGVIKLAVKSYGPTLQEAELNSLRQTIYNRSATQKGIGLKNIYDRLLLHFGHEAAFHIDSLEGKGFEVMMTIPINK
ncbi:cache domain-containing sensor histidine kinase [Priestia flexa]|uniref:cache domain-containing sensor histidine kinase n=1 Tax=Priestia flexa TaxID=86664 RepID=UPI0010FBC8FD|nr:sensor histidine kinase [Priestia flexa]MCG7314444.1 sensor histidine kinase [Priestia flexa]QCS51311.1 sensor histidine kinase [Priestia flexa]